jgi:hypothetical protein
MWTTVFSLIFTEWLHFERFLLRKANYCSHQVRFDVCKSRSHKIIILESEMYIVLFMKTFFDFENLFIEILFFFFRKTKFLCNFMSTSSNQVYWQELRDTPVNWTSSCMVSKFAWGFHTTFSYVRLVEGHVRNEVDRQSIIHLVQNETTIHKLVFYSE